MAVYHTTELEQQQRAMRNPYVTPRVPAIGRVLDAILEACDVGGCIMPGVRALSDAADVALGQISTILYQLAADGWISYDGRVISVLADPYAEGDRSADQHGDQHTDQPIDQPIDRDRSIDRSPIDHSIDHRPDPPPQGVPMPPIAPPPRASRSHAAAPQKTGADRSIDRDVYRIGTPPGMGDQSSDRSDAMHMESYPSSSSRSESRSAAALKNLPCAAETDHPADRSPAADALAALGADPKIIADALHSRPDLTADQVAATWSHFAPRIQAGLVGPGAFFAAIRAGVLHAAPRPPGAAIEPADYAGVPGFAVGDHDPPDAAETPHDIARRIAPDDCGGRDFLWLVQQLAGGASEAGALAGLADRRRR